jgi:competence protein ComEA
MRYLWIYSLVLTMLVSVWLLPSEDIYVSRLESQPSFQITVTGAVVFPKTLTFYEPVTYEEILNYVGGFNQSDVRFTPPTYVFTQSHVLHIPEPVQNIIETETTLKVNINTASFQQLISIPYMTETRAAELIIYRREHGFFDSIEGLIHVKYIGAATIENLRPFISTT